MTFSTNLALNLMLCNLANAEGQISTLTMDSNSNKGIWPLIGDAHIPAPKFNTLRLVTTDGSLLDKSKFGSTDAPTMVTPLTVHNSLTVVSNLSRA